MPAARDDAVHVHSVQEEYFYLMVHCCACGGPWLSESQDIDESGPKVLHTVRGRCFKCRQERRFRFTHDTRPDPKSPIRQINATAEPSHALDVAEWMDLAQFYLERIERLKNPVERAQSLLDARQCIEEAVKFYGPGDDGVPASALWSDESRKKVSRRRDAFRRASLSQMIEKIPPMDRLRQADALEQKEFQKAVKDLARRKVGKWWQVWKRWGK